MASVYAIRQLMSDAARVDRVSRAVAALEAQIGTVLEIGGALRGYLIAGNEVYLVPYRPAVAAIRQRFDSLRHQLDDPDQRQRLDSVVTLVERRIAVADSILDIGRRQGLEPARARWRLGVGLQLQEVVRTSIARIQSTERTRLAAARETAEGSGRRLTWVILAGSLSAILIIVAGALMIWRSLEDARRADEALRAANVSLDARVRERTAELEQALAAKRVTEARLENMVAAAPVVLGETRHGPNGERNDWFAPGRLAELYGLSEDEMRADPSIVASRVPPEDQQGLLASMAEAGRTGTTWQYEWRYRHPARGEIWIETQSRPVPQPDGSTIWYGALIDATSRKRIEVELAERAAALARSNADLQQFAYITSHDLQEPLRAVAGCVQLLQRRYQGRLDAAADELITHASDGAMRMQGLLTDLLAYSRLSQAARYEPTDLGPVLAAALSNLESAIRDAGTVVTHDPMPVVSGHAPHLLSVFQNLIGNAIKFRGTAPLVVHIGAVRTDAAWELSVRDNGIGIESRFIDRLFVVFQRLHTRAEYPGTGIGLAMCRRIVEQHGGRIWVESTPGAGSVFRFTLPAATAASEDGVHVVS